MDVVLLFPLALSLFFVLFYIFAYRIGPTSQLVRSTVSALSE